MLELAIEAASNAIINIKEDLNDWDGKVGDGDCGSTVSLFFYIFCPQISIDIICTILGFADVQRGNGSARRHEKLVSPYSGYFPQCCQV